MDEARTSQCTRPSLVCCNRGDVRVTQPGFTLLEVLVVLAVLALVSGIGMAAFRPSLEVRAASAVRSLVLQARAQAVWSGDSVAVVESAGGTSFSALSMTSKGGCEPGSALASLRLLDFPGVRLVDGLRAGGLYWLPSGSGRSCSGGGVISDTLLFEGPRGKAALVISSLGRVRVEARP